MFFPPYLPSSVISALYYRKSRWRGGGEGLKERKKEENMYSLPSPQIRDTLEVTETEWSNPLGPTSKAGGFGEKIRTAVKDSEELPKLSAASRALPPHLRKEKREGTTDQTCTIPGIIRNTTFNEWSDWVKKIWPPVLLIGLQLRK